MRGWEQKMDNSNFWDWDNEDEHKVSSVYRDNADETENVKTQGNTPQNDIRQNENAVVQDKKTQNNVKSTDMDRDTDTGTQKSTVPTDTTENNFILVDNPQSDAPFAQTQYEQPENQQTGYEQPGTRQTQYQQTDFQQIIPVQNTQQNQGTNRQKTNRKFTPEDISENKVSAMAAYLLGPMGIIIALLIARDSAYTAFHVRQALKLTVCSVALEIIAAILALFGMIPLVGIIFKLVFIIICAIWLGVLVLRLVAIAQVCDGEAREPVIIGKMSCFH